MPLSAELGMWHAGTPSEKIIQHLCRSTHRGLAWGALILQGMTHARYEGTAMLCAEKQREPDSPCARNFLLFCLLVLRRVERTDDTEHEFKVRSKKWGWWGRQQRPHTRDPERLAELLEDERQRADAWGCEPRPAWRLNREYVPKLHPETGRHQQLGLAGGVDVCVRTIGRYASIARQLGLFRSHQPRADSPGANMPRFGSWSYPEWILLRTPPEGLLTRLQRWWGERTSPGRRPDRARAGEAPRAPVGRYVHTPTGPPQGWLQAAQPDDDLARDIEALLA